VLGLDPIQQGQGRLGLLLHLREMPGHPEQGLGGEGAGWRLLEQLVPGFQGLGMGSRPVGPLPGTEQTLRQIRLLGTQNQRQGQDHGGDAQPPWAATHGGLGQFG